MIKFLACGRHGTEEKLKEVLVQESKGRNHLEDIYVYERIILKWILNSLDLPDSGLGAVAEKHA